MLKTEKKNSQLEPKQWEDLTMAEKAAMMRAAVTEGIYDLPTIKAKYNEFAKGGKKDTPDTQWTMQDEADYRHWRNSLPANLKNTDDRLYDMRSAYKAGMQPVLNDDGFYHLGSRDPKTGRILKSATHPTYLEALMEDARMGYYPKTVGDQTYTQTWEGNKFAGGGVLGWFKSLFTSEPEIKYRALDGSVHSTKGAAARWNGHLVKSGKVYYQEGSRIKGVKPKVVSRQPNTSPTAEKSTTLENKIYTYIDGLRERTNYRTKNYDIPYGDKEIKVQPKGSTLPINISVNALDSVAKYAGVTGTPITTALGLPMQETTFGKRPVFNFGKLGEEYSSRDLGNVNYFKNFGSIPAEYLVRDFRYNGDQIINGKRDKQIPLSTPPLQHAFEYFNSGNYNRGDKNHTSDVKKAGNALWNETTGSLLNWWKTEGKEWYDKGSKQKKR